MIVSPTQNDLFVKLQAFVMDVLTLDGEKVIQGIDNGVPMPLGGFVAMTEVGRTRLATNTSRYIDSSPTMAKESTQATKVSFQLDCYGPASSDWAAILATLLRDEYGCTALAPEMQPLFTDEPRMMPLVDGEQQYEQRWMVLAEMQVNATVSSPMEFFDQAEIGLVEVDSSFPPAPLITSFGGQLVETFAGQPIVSGTLEG